jgi:hypothetical protein
MLIYISNLLRTALTLFILITVIVLSACGQLSMKQGANLDDFEGDKKLCQSKDIQKNQETCLKEKGWNLFQTSQPVYNKDSQPVNIEKDLHPEPSKDYYKVLSWWKVKGTSDDWSHDIKQCPRAENSDIQSSYVTKDCLDYMEKLGWKALLEPFQ